MTVEAELMTMMATGGGGFLAGWGFGKLVKVVIKIVAVITGGIFALIMYMHTQGIIIVDWKQLQDVGTQSALWITSLVPVDSVQNVATNVGISSTMALVPGFFFGFMKGVRS